MPTVLVSFIIMLYTKRILSSLQFSAVGMINILARYRPMRHVI